MIFVTRSFLPKLETTRSLKVRFHCFLVVSKVDSLREVQLLKYLKLGIIWLYNYAHKCKPADFMQYLSGTKTSAERFFSKNGGVVRGKMPLLQVSSMSANLFNVSRRKVLFESYFQFLSSLLLLSLIHI